MTTQIAAGIDVSKFLNELPPVERQQLLVAIADSLSSSDREYLQTRLIQWSCNQKDVFGSLPLELVHEVARHLPLYKIIEFQRVSKQWRRICSNLEVLRTSLKAWQPTCPAMGTSSSAEEAAASIVTEARRIKAFTNAKPFGRFRFSTNAWHIEPIACGHFMAFTKSCQLHGDSVCCANFKTGQLHNLRPRDRSQIGKIVLSATHLFWTTHSGYCTSFSLEAQHWASVRLPSAVVDRVRARDHYIAAVECTRRFQAHILAICPVSLDIRVWDCVSGSLRSINNIPMEWHEYDILIHSGGAKITLFGFSARADAVEWVVYGANGTLISTNRYRMNVSRSLLLEHGIFGTLNNLIPKGIVPLDDQGLWIIDTLEKPRHFLKDGECGEGDPSSRRTLLKPNGPPQSLILYDEKTNAIAAVHCGEDEFCESPDRATVTACMTWKNVRMFPVPLKDPTCKQAPLSSTYSIADFSSAAIYPAVEKWISDMRMVVLAEPRGGDVQGFTPTWMMGGERMVFVRYNNDVNEYQEHRRVPFFEAISFDPNLKTPYCEGLSIVNERGEVQY